VWRLQTDEGDATALRVFPDPEVIVNLSVWTSVEALHDFVYRSAHTPFAFPLRAPEPPLLVGRASLDDPVVADLINALGRCFSRSIA
jgi:hypothetical protein